jgi:hypothetical protein
MQRWNWLTVIVLACAGCASPWAVDRYEAPEGNIPARQAFFLKAGELGAAGGGVGASAEARMDQAVQAAIVEQLTLKGYAQVADATKADLVVSYQVAGARKFVIEEQTRIGAPSPTSVLSPSAAQPPPLSTIPREQAVREGSVIVYADDPASGRLIWRGLITAETRAGSTEEGIRTVADMARHITQEFPARQGAK